MDVTLIKRNWLLGMRIHKEVLKEQRAEYGEQVVKTLTRQLVARYGDGFRERNLYYFVDFYQTHQDFFQSSTGKPLEIQVDEIFKAASGKSVNLHTACAESDVLPNILHTLRAKSTVMLSWSHYRVILQEKTKEARDWYEHEAAQESWGVRTLQRNISTQYYHRILQSHHKELVRQEMIEKTTPLQERLEFIKNPVIAEFLGFPQTATFTESELETSIINNLQRFLMELGKGYAFVTRQQHIHTEKRDYYIDLVFYNYLLKSFVLIDLKTETVTHQDVGQMDMYVRMYDELKRGEGDNPTIGLLICADTDEDIARYSVLHDSDQLFMAKYKTYMPTDEELRAEIEAQKKMFYLQKQAEEHNGQNED